MAKKEQEKIKTTHETHSLKCQLAEAEVAVAADELAEGLDQLEAIEDEKKATMENFKARAALIEAQAKVNKNLVRDKYIYRRVTCDLVLDYTKLAATLTRMDTKEIITERAMTADEKQMDLGFDGEEGKGAA